MTRPPLTTTRTHPPFPEPTVCRSRTKTGPTPIPPRPPAAQLWRAPARPPALARAPDAAPWPAAHARPRDLPRRAPALRERVLPCPAREVACEIGRAHV